MSKRRVFRIERSRTPYIGTTLVLLGGSTACLAIATPFSTDLRYPILMIAGLLLGLSLMLGFLRQSTVDLLTEIQAASKEKRKKRVPYKIKILKPIQQTGPRMPPTAETIREIRGK